MNFTLNTPKEIVLNYSDICPTQNEIYMTWYKSYVILFGVSVFIIIILFCISEYEKRELQKEIDKLIKP